MTKTRSTAGRLLLLCFALGVGVQCSDPVPKTMDERLRDKAIDKRRDKFVERVDVNGDGKVQVSELPEQKQKRAAAVDKDGDGVLSDQERAKARMKRGRARFSRKDMNGDGALDPLETNPKVWSKIRAADTDKDGKVTRAELKEARKQGLLGRWRK